MNSKSELLIEITKKCGLNCKYCSSNSDKNSSLHLNFKTIESLIKDSTKLNISNVQLSGGEPFLHQDFLKICKLIISNKKILDIYTSGNIFHGNKLTPLDNSFLEELKKLKINELRFNLQSHKKAIHNFLTNTKSFENTITSIKNSINLGLNVVIHFIPLKVNYKLLEDSICFFKNLGVSRVKLLRFVPHGRGAINNKILELTKNEYINLIKILFELKEKYEDFIEIGSSFNIYFNKQNITFCRECRMGKHKIAITPGGNVYPCVSTKHFKIFNFNINEKSLYEIIKSKRYISIITRLMDNLIICNCLPENTLNSLKNLCPTQEIMQKN
ncbi:MAG: radical SAM protein [Promethearchaeota archaeon]